MRTSVGVLGGIVILFVGFHGLNRAASGVESTASATGNETQAAFNTSQEVFGGIGQAAGPAIVWMGIAAFILVALGYLVVAGNSGR